MDQQQERLEFYGGKYFAIVPFLVFLVVVAVLSLKLAINLTAMISGGIAGLIVGSFFAKDWTKYWQSVQRGFTEQPVGIAFSVLFVAGIFAMLMTVSGLATGLVWLGDSINLTGSAFVAFAFLASGVLALATGTSLGTVFTMTPILFPAGVILGGNPLFLAGAILSGAALGDNMAPVSDTTILSAISQRYKNIDGTADVGGVVRTRLKYAVLAGIPAFILYLIVGGGSMGDSAAAARLLAENSNPAALAMLIPIFIVIYVAVKGMGIFKALIYGIVSGAIVGFITGLLRPSDFMYIENGNPMGIITEGVGKMFEGAIILLVIIGLLAILKDSGVVDAFMTGMAKKATSVVKSELVMLALSTVWCGLSAGVNTIVVAITGPLNGEIGQRYNIHPYRRANLTDATANTFSYFIPWSAFVFIFILVADGLKGTYPFLEVPGMTSFFFAVFYPLFLWIVLLIAVLTGYGRTFEGENGEEIRAKDYRPVDRSM